MNKIIAIASLFALLFFGTVCKSQVNEMDYSEQKASAEWVLDTAHEGKVHLGTSEAKKIVESIYWHSERLQIDPIFALAVIRVESRFNTHARSHEGAMGLMQVLTRVHRKELRGRSPYDAGTNIEVGMNILSECIRSSRGSTLRALNCYSGGGGIRYLKAVRTHQRDLQHYVIAKLFNDESSGSVQVASNP